ncbi:MAG: hypothetical protein LBS11_13060 [Oscillospiraceae bacterium]|jgi:hypothetical protein|nr:hypothetical protein [Oscillospiraceae bacterium]
MSIKVILTCLLVLTMLSGAAVYAESAAGSGLEYAKEETVYGALDASGGVRGLYIVNTLLSDESGVAVDYGGYASLTNLTGADGLAFIPEEQAVEVTLEAGEPFSYQGTLADTTLPWIFMIRYTLDGEEISPEELGGKSGRLGVMVGAVRNAAAPDSSYFDNYALQASLALSKRLCRNVSASGAILADAGMSRQVTATALPGSPLYFSLEADVTDFEMGAVTIAAAPFSMDIPLPDIKPMLAQFDQLTDGSALIQQALADMSSALDTAMNGDEESGQPAMPSVTQMNQGLTLMNAALTGTSRQLGQMETGLAAIADSISQLAAALPTEPITEESLAALYEAAPESKALLDQLAAGYAAAAAAGSALAEAQPQAAAFAQAIPPLRTGLDTVSGNLSQAGTQMAGMVSQAEGLTQLLDGLNQLSEQYGQFHEGVASIPDKAAEAIDGMMASFDRSGYQPESFADPRIGVVDAVQFTLRADAITAPGVVFAGEPEPEAESFLQRLANLFR